MEKPVSRDIQLYPLGPEALLSDYSVILKGELGDSGMAILEGTAEKVWNDGKVVCGI